MQVSTVDITPFLEDSSGYRGSADRVFVPSGQDELRQIVQEASRIQMPLTVAAQARV